MALTFLDYQELLKKLKQEQVVGAAKRNDPRSWMAAFELKRREDMRSAEAAEAAEEEGGPRNVVEEYIARASRIPGASPGAGSPMMPTPQSPMLMAQGPQGPMGAPPMMGPQPPMPGPQPPMPAQAPTRLARGGGVEEEEDGGFFQAPDKSWEEWVFGDPEVQQAGLWGPGLAAAFAYLAPKIGAAAAKKLAPKLAKQFSESTARGMPTARAAAKYGSMLPAAGAGLLLGSAMDPPEATPPEGEVPLNAGIATQGAVPGGGSRPQQDAGGEGDEAGASSIWDKVKDLTGRYRSLDESIQATAPGPYDQLWEQLGAFGGTLATTPGDFGVGFGAAAQAATQVPASIRQEQRQTQGERVALVAAEADLEIALEELAISMLIASVRSGGRDDELTKDAFFKTAGDRGWARGIDGEFDWRKLNQIFHRAQAAMGPSMRTAGSGSNRVKLNRSGQWQE